MNLENDFYTFPLVYVYGRVVAMSSVSRVHNLLPLSFCNVSLRFETPETLVGLVESMDLNAGNILAAICGRLVQNYRHMRSGMPDLCLWNREAKKWILVEVKGPNDKLSTKQVTVK